jgi:hypothetical protein
MDRRLFLMGSTAAAAASAVAFPTLAAQRASAAPAIKRLDAEIDELQQRTFQWFVDVTDRDTA